MSSVVLLVVMFIGMSFGETKGEVTVRRRVASMEEAVHREEGLNKIVSMKEGVEKK